MIDLHDSSPASTTPAPAFDRAALLATLSAAQRQARATNAPALASYTQQLPFGDPLAAFALFMQTETPATTFYWAHPSEGRAFAGLGAAATITAETIAEAAGQWRALLAHSCIHVTPDFGDGHLAELAGPRCFGGFAFDPAAPRTSLWEGFPVGLLILPQLQISAVSGRYSLTLNALIGATDDVAGAMDRMTSLLDRLDSAIVQRERDEVDYPAQSLQLATRNLQPKSQWWQMVEETTAAIRRGAYRKVVLARSVEAQAPATLSAPETLRRLHQRYPEAHIFALRRGRRTFLGATPEQLGQVTARQLKTMALAGSAPRGATVAEDDALGDALLSETKTRTEHAVVAAMLRRALAPLTRTLHAPDEPQLFRLPNVQHLLTPITGELLSGVTILDVAAALHPTPAVAGDPRDAALAEIRRLEGVDRGWYAGPVGWIGADGSGEFAVALRSALVEDNTATLFAGCGIVAGSEPQAEYDESFWKLQVMLRSLGGEE